MLEYKHLDEVTQEDILVIKRCVVDALHYQMHIPKNVVQHHRILCVTNCIEIIASVHASHIAGRPINKGILYYSSGKLNLIDNMCFDYIVIPFSLRHHVDILSRRLRLGKKDSPAYLSGSSLEIVRF